MAKRNIGNNLLFKKVREYEKIALKAGIIEPYEIHTSTVMREEAWICYLYSKLEFLENVIKERSYTIQA